MLKKFSIPLVIFFTVIGALIGVRFQEVVSSDTLRDQLIKFNDVLSYTQKYYVEDVDTQKLVEAAINGLLGTLDPHSVYIPASQVPRVEEEFRGNFEGIGIEFDVINDTLIVIAPVAGGPSESLGILAADKIVKIDGVSSVGIKRDEVPKKLRGSKGTKVKVSIARSGIKELLEFEITRDKINLYSIRAAIMIDKDIGYVTVRGFTATTHDEFIAALKKLKASGMKKLILDLRDNPGGYLEQAFKMADEFISGGKKIVYTKGRRPEFSEEYYATAGNEFESLPLIVLINAGSASASEIVTGAIQDWDRGLVVGETSFGKGLVQKQFDLKDGSAFRLTTARYYTPSGRLIQRPFNDKGKEKYTKEAYERNEKEGENLEHKAEGDSARPIFHTSSGRIVYGGGGITPDYIVKPPSLTSYTSNLWRQRVFDEFNIHYMDRHGQKIRQKYEKNFNDFKSHFEVNEQMISDFGAFAKSKGVEFKQDEFAKDANYIKTTIKAFIARNLWGWEGLYQILFTTDVQFQKAMMLFPEAEKIAGLK